jgi:hypothetical protein
VGGGGVFRLDGACLCWRGVNEGLSDFYVNDLQFDPQGTLYASTTQGVFQLAAPAVRNWTATASASGPLAQQSVNVNLVPDQADLGAAGCIFFGASLAGIGPTFTLGTQGWAPYQADAPTAYQLGKLTSTQAELAGSADLRSLVGTTVLAGYGLGAKADECMVDMLANGSFKAVYVVQ